MPLLGITIDAPDQDTAYKIGIMILQGIQAKLRGSRSGRWYPAPGNRLYDKNFYSALPKDQKKRINYYIKFTGTQYRNEIIGAAYQASAPGEAPAARTGRLRQSFFMSIIMKNSQTYTVDIHTNVIYAGDLEEGTIKVDARPYIAPVIHDLLPEINRLKINGILRKYFA